MGINGVVDVASPIFVPCALAVYKLMQYNSQQSAVSSQQSAVSGYSYLKPSFFLAYSLNSSSLKKFPPFDFAALADNEIGDAGEDAFGAPVNTLSTLVVDGRSDNFYNLQPQWSRSDGETECFTRLVLCLFFVYCTFPSLSAPHVSFAPFAVPTGPPSC